MFSSRYTYLHIIVVGFFLVLFGFAVPFLMCIKVMAPNLALEFLSFGASVAGLLLGVVGASCYSDIHSE